MLIYIILGIVVVIGLGIVLVTRQASLSAANEQNQLPSLERNVFNLQIGDIVQYLEGDWVVEGKLTYEEEGFTWFEYMVQDGDRICWLSVEEDDRVVVCWLEQTNALDISFPPPQKLNLSGVAYTCTDSGIANMTRQGILVRRDGEQCQYYDYEAPGGKILSIENWQGDIEVTMGEKIRPSVLSLLPGDGRRVYDS